MIGRQAHPDSITIDHENHLLLPISLEILKRRGSQKAERARAKVRAKEKEKAERSVGESLVRVKARAVAKVAMVETAKERARADRTRGTRFGALDPRGAQTPLLRLPEGRVAKTSRAELDPYLRVQPRVEPVNAHLARTTRTAFRFGQAESAIPLTHAERSMCAPILPTPRLDHLMRGTDRRAEKVIRRNRARQTTKRIRKD